MRIITANSFRLCIGLPCFTDHSRSPLRYSHKPRKLFPDALILNTQFFGNNPHFNPNCLIYLIEHFTTNRYNTDNPSA